MSHKKIVPKNEKSSFLKKVELNRDANSFGKQRPIISVKKPGRNTPCPCGSGKKFKKCCKEIPVWLGPTHRSKIDRQRTD